MTELCYNTIKEKSEVDVMPTKDEYIEKLNLTPHPEGGWYRQVYHSAKTHYDETSLASRYEYTSIYFILDGGLAIASAPIASR